MGSHDIKRELNPIPIKSHPTYLSTILIGYIFIRNTWVYSTTNIQSFFSFYFTLFSQVKNKVTSDRSLKLLISTFRILYSWYRFDIDSDLIEHSWDYRIWIATRIIYLHARQSSRRPDLHNNAQGTRDLKLNA